MCRPLNKVYHIRYKHMYVSANKKKTIRRPIQSIKLEFLIQIKYEYGIVQPKCQFIK